MYTKNQIEKLEKFQTNALKTLLGLSKSVKREIVRILCGIEPISARFEILRLNFYLKIRADKKDRLLYQTLMYHLSTLLNRNPDHRSQKIAKKSVAYEVQKTLIKIGNPALFTKFEIPETILKKYSARTSLLKVLIRKTHFEKNLLVLEKSESCHFSLCIFQKQSLFRLL